MFTSAADVAACCADGRLSEIFDEFLKFSKSLRSAGLQEKGVAGAGLHGSWFTTNSINTCVWRVLWDGSLGPGLENH